MKGYLPPKRPLTPKQAADRRARAIAKSLTIATWLAVALPLVLMLMVYGYSDQAPAALRGVTIALDSLFGQPVWRLINPAGGG